MKQTTFDISFYCRESKANREGLAPVEMSIIINGERCIITLPRKEKHRVWIRHQRLGFTAGAFSLSCLWILVNSHL